MVHSKYNNKICQTPVFLMSTVFIETSITGAYKVEGFRVAFGLNLGTIT